MRLRTLLLGLALAFGSFEMAEASDNRVQPVSHSKAKRAKQYRSGKYKAPKQGKFKMPKQKKYKKPHNHI